MESQVAVVLGILSDMKALLAAGLA